MIYFGYTTMTHGLKGELKLYTNFSLKEKVLKESFPLYFQNQKHILSGVRVHQNHYLITIDGRQDINLVEEFRNQQIFIDEKDLSLKEGEVVVEMLFHFSVYEGTVLLGKVNDILYNKSGILLEISEGSKRFYLPYQNHFILQVDREKRILFVKGVRGVLDSF